MAAAHGGNYSKKMHSLPDHSSLQPYQTPNLLENISDLYEQKFCIFEISPQLYCVCLYVCHMNGSTVYSEHDKRNLCKKLLDCVPHNVHVLVCLNLEEINNYETIVPWYLEFNHQLQNLKDSGSLKNFTIISNSSLNKFYNQRIIDFASPLPNFMSVHWFLLTYSNLYTALIEMDFSTNKVLFLPGKLDKIHRIGPLFDILTRKHFKERCVYAYTADQHSWNGQNTQQAEIVYTQTLLNCVKEYADIDILPSDLMNLLTADEIDLDGLQELSKQNNRALMQPVPLDIYRGVSVELVSETFFPACIEHITEKTFRPMLAGRPFIHVSSMTTRYLEHLGFKTFRSLPGDGWISHGYYNIDSDMYSNDREISMIDLKRNVQAAFDLAKHCTYQYSHSHIQHIVNYNRTKCSEIVNKYVEQLNQRHENIFTPDVLLRFSSIFGLY